MNPLSGKYSVLYQKNAHLVESLVFRRAPGFVYQSHPGPLAGELPVFTFHTAWPERFERQCRHLADNGYRTLTAAGALAAMKDPGAPLAASVMITFDDGLKHVWTVAYPLLKKYNLKAVCFLIPGCMNPDDRRVRPTLEQVQCGQASMEEILALQTGDALITWEEARIMQASGVIDFQSHTHLHGLVHVSNRIIDFFSPSYPAYYYGNVHVPLYVENGVEATARQPAWGHPIYASAPRMAAARRYFDDEGLRRQCVEEVARRGGAEFFRRNGWRRELHQVAARYRAGTPPADRYETGEERDASLVRELARAKAMIEEQLSGPPVKHLCFPWYEAGDFAVRAAVAAGYEAAYFGQRKGRITNRPGDDPMGMVRVEDMFLLRLPGAGRETLSRLFCGMIGPRT